MRLSHAIIMLLWAIPAVATGPFAPLDSPWKPPSEQQVGYYKTQRLILNIQRGRALDTTSNVVASTCRQKLVLSDFLDREELKLKPSDKEIPTINADLAAPPSSVHDIFKLIRLTILGRAILKKFMPKYGFDVKVLFQSKAEIQQQTRNTAIASFDIRDRTIRIDKSARLGSVAYVLLHEIIHALDVDFTSGTKKLEKLNQNYEAQLKQLVVETSRRLGKPKDYLIQRDFDPKEIDRLVRMKTAADQMQDILVFRAERFAHDASYDVWKTLAKLFPDFYTDSSNREITSRYPRNMNEKPYFHENDQIIELNNLNPLVIQRYLEGKCVPYGGDLSFFNKNASF